MSRRTFRNVMILLMIILVMNTCAGTAALLDIKGNTEKPSPYQNVLIESSQIDQIVEALKPTPVVVKPVPVVVRPTPIEVRVSQQEDRLNDLVRDINREVRRIRGAVERTATSTHHLVLMGHSQGGDVSSPSTDTSQGSTEK